MPLQILFHYRCKGLLRASRLTHPFSTSQIFRQNPRRLSNYPTPGDKMAAPADYSQVPTPGRCYVDFCLIPVGTGSVSVAQEVAEVQKLLQASGLTYTMHSAGTTVEGSWEDVMKVIGQAHTVVHRTGAVRVQTSMRAGTRTDKAQTAAQKVQRVQELLAKNDSSS